VAGQHGFDDPGYHLQKMPTTKPALPRDPQVDLMRFAYVEAIDDVAAIDQSRTYDQPVAPGFSQ
jgi:hypothetical protein